MGDPAQLVCSICGDEYFLHPANEKPVAHSDLCPTCETFQLGMKYFYADESKKDDKRVLGWLILLTSGLCIWGLLLWLVFGR